jgi:hypothetical protein
MKVMIDGTDSDVRNPLKNIDLRRYFPTHPPLLRVLAGQSPYNFWKFRFRVNRWLIEWLVQLAIRRSVRRRSSWRLAWGLARRGCVS